MCKFESSQKESRTLSGGSPKACKFSIVEKSEVRTTVKHSGGKHLMIDLQNERLKNTTNNSGIGVTKVSLKVKQGSLY